MKLTDIALQKLPRPDKGQRFYADDQLRGFGVRVSQGGTKTFMLRLGREKRQINLGHYPTLSLQDGRRKAASVLRDRELGILERRRSPTLKEVKSEYFARRDAEVRAATLQGDRYLFRHFDGLMSHRIDDITPDHIERVIDGIEAPSTRRSAYIRISGLMSFAVRKGYIERSPVKAIPIPPDQEPRHRVLSDDELRRVLTYARIGRIAGDQYATILECLLYTGQRRQMIAGLKRSNVDFENAVLRWEPSEMKTGKRHSIPLGDHMRELLEARETSGLYFGNRLGQPFCGWSYHFRKLCHEVGFGDFVLHDIRRALATRWQEWGIDIATTEKLLGHSAITGGLVGVYQASTYMRQMREAIKGWELFLQDLRD